jgi:hypothetical protein
MISIPAPLRVWLKVVLCLAGIDLVLSQTGLFWKARPDFGSDTPGQNWSMLFQMARLFERHPHVPSMAFIAGSSVVRLGIDERLINQTLRQKGLPVTAVRLVSLGATSLDSAIIVERALRLRPWLIVYGAAVRDFPRVVAARSPVTEVFYDSSIALRLPGPRTPDDVLDAHVKRYWKLYRYRFFARTILATWGASLARRVAPARAFGQQAAEGWLPPRGPLFWFDPERVSRESFAAWQRWRESGEFGDYLEWMRRNAPAWVLQAYRGQRMEVYGPTVGTSWLALRWLLQRIEEEDARAVVAHFPENPVFRVPEAAEYFDAELSDAWAQVFARQAALHGARHVDLRDALEPEEFYDLNHANVQGRRKLSLRIAALIEEEWRAYKERLPVSE